MVQPVLWCVVVSLPTLVLSEHRKVWALQIYTDLLLYRYKAYMTVVSTS